MATDGPLEPDGRSTPPGDRAPAGWLHLGYSDLVWLLRPTEHQLHGKWCSRCEGVWFGFMLEVACPRCGGRSG